MRRLFSATGGRERTEDGGWGGARGGRKETWRPKGGVPSFRPSDSSSRSDDDCICVEEPERGVEDSRSFIDAGEKRVDDGACFVDDGAFFIDDGPFCIDDGEFFIDDGPFCIDDGPFCIEEKERGMASVRR
jgi:hypothetical protein